jgi:hypothetical protein
MNQPPHRLWVGNSSGFITVKHLVLIAIVFGGYTGYKFLSVYFAKSQLKHAVEVVLEETNHLMADEMVKSKIVRRAAVSSLTLEPSQIELQRETRTGQRILYVGVQYPVPVSYLGSERTVNADVYMTKVYRVNEAAEVRRLERERRQEENRRRAEQVRKRHDTAFKEAWMECQAKHGVGNCQVLDSFGPAGGEPGEIVKLY